MLSSIIGLYFIAKIQEFSMNCHHRNSIADETGDNEQFLVLLITSGNKKIESNSENLRVVLGFCASTVPDFKLGQSNLYCAVPVREWRSLLSTWERENQSHYTALREECPGEII